MQKTIIKGISFNAELYKALEMKRGRKSRSAFINDLLESAVAEYLPKQPATTATPN